MDPNAPMNSAGRAGGYVREKMAAADTEKANMRLSKCASAAGRGEVTGSARQ